MKLSNWIARRTGALSIGHQLGIAAGALCLFLAAVTSVVAGIVSARQMAGMIKQELAWTSQVFADQLSTTLSTRYHEVGTISRLEPLRTLWRGNPDRLRVVLEELQNSYAEYSWIGFADADGKVVAATKGMLEGMSVAARPWFQNGLRSATVEDVHDAKLLAQLLGPQPSGEPFRFVDVAFPIHDDAGRTIGVLGAHLSWTFASSLQRRLLNASKSPGNLNILILSKEGHVLLGDMTGSRPF